ncbi:unnamed protein product [Enterobius vermicularis]|uniref:Girdin n=1 Tax=Enterobius vermicularis TaxID=51028 RepID=A0A0N4UZN2_ENTVE|nr:unnamed protein product [Enterobius vermicularis]
MSLAGGGFDKNKGEALLHFVVAIGVKAELAEVGSLTELAGRHVPMLAGTIYTKQLQCIGASAEPLQAYQKAKEVLLRFDSVLCPSKYLDEKQAAGGDPFEICKFLLALLNELRCTYPEAFGGDALINSRLSDDCQRKIADMLNYLDDPDLWDTFKSWPAILMDPSKLCYESPKNARSRIAFSTGPHSHSPLSEAVSTPVARANRKLREKEKRIKELTESLTAKEIEYDDLEKKLRRLDEENKRLFVKLESFTSKTGDYTRLEMENSHLTEQLQNLEQELKDAKCSLTEKRERLALNEEHIVKLQRSYDTVRDGAELLQTQLKEKNEVISRLRADLDTADMHNIESRKQTFEEELRETKSLYNLEKNATRAKVADYEEALASAHARAHELYAKLSLVERWNKENCGRQMEPLVSRVQHLQINFHDLKNDFLAMVEVVQRLIAENKKQKEASDELRIGHENLKELYEKVLCSEKRWKSSAESSFASGKQLRDHCTKLEETLNDVFQIFDATANKASEYEGRIQDLEMEVASLKAENAVLQKKGFDSRLSNVSSACTPRSNLPSGRESDFVPAVEKIKEIDNAQMPENAAYNATASGPHPLPRSEDEGDWMESKSINGVEFRVVTPAKSFSKTYFLDVDSATTCHSDDSISSTPSGRYLELHERNMRSKPHMRTYAYPEVVEAAIEEDTFRNSSSFKPPSQKKKKVLRNSTGAVFGAFIVFGGGVTCGGIDAVTVNFGALV